MEIAGKTKKKAVIYLIISVNAVAPTGGLCEGSKVDLCPNRSQQFTLLKGSAFQLHRLHNVPAGYKLFFHYIYDHIIISFSIKVTFPFNIFTFIRDRLVSVCHFI